MTTPSSGGAGHSSHFHELDGMRGALAVVVMLYHLGLNGVVALATGGVIENGAWGLCVDFFFVLSGFVLCRSFAKRPPGLRDYAIKRVLRLAPMFLITTLLVLAIAKQEPWDTVTTAANLLMVQPFLGLASINFPAWSIPFELFLPVIWLVPLPLVSKLPMAGLSIFLAGLLAAQGATAFIVAGGGDLPLARASTGLASGAVLYLLREKAGPAKGSAGTALALFGAGVGVMALGGEAPLLAALFPTVAAGAIWIGADAKGLFSSAPAQALGRWSYSIYLIHIPVLLAAERWMGAPAVQGLIPKLLIVAAAIVLAAFAYRVIERPFMELGYRRAAGQAARKR